VWQAILRAGRTGDFPANPGRLCDWCDHKSRCPAFGGTPPPYPGWPEPDAAATESPLDRAD
jgi:putative RecB family exonuclease